MRHPVWERRRSNYHIMLLPGTVKVSRGVLGGCTFLVDEMDVPGVCYIALGHEDIRCANLNVRNSHPPP